jgi:hypothetical protein
MQLRYDRCWIDEAWAAICPEKEESVQGYCLKCREKRDMVDAQEVTLKNNRPAMQGKCAVCGTKITVIGGKKAAEKIEQSDNSDNFSAADAGDSNDAGAAKGKAASKGSKATAKS